MRVKINIPEISALRDAVALKFGSSIQTPRHFSSLSFELEDKLKEYLSETTLQRLWQYKAGYGTVAIHTLNVLSHYVGQNDWISFCQKLKENSDVESIMFEGDCIDVPSLKIGSKIRIAWRPDRECIIQYLGNYRFEAIETHNSKLSAGDTFACSRIQKGREMQLDNLIRGQSDMSYVIGTRNGITDIEVLD